MTSVMHLLCFVAVTAVLRTANSLDCLHCTSSKGGICDDPLNNTQSIRCKDHEDACLILKVTNKGQTEITRGCTFEGYCSKMREKREFSYSKSCFACTWDLCNSATKMTPVQVFLSVLAFNLFKYVL